MRSDQVLQICIYPLLERGQERIANSVDFAPLGGQLDARGLCAIHLGSCYCFRFGYFQRIFVECLRNVLLTGRISM